jgi:hypothetical protein
VILQLVDMTTTSIRSDTYLISNGSTVRFGSNRGLLRV